MRVENAPGLLLIEPHAPRKLGIADASLAHREINSSLQTLGLRQLGADVL
jgi:hypothetical protein